jgi:hypothetical protein
MTQDEKKLFSDLIDTAISCMESQDIPMSKKDFERLEIGKKETAALFKEFQKDPDYGKVKKIEDTQQWEWLEVLRSKFMKES